jgi:hypothetical protein
MTEIVRIRKDHDRVLAVSKQSQVAVSLYLQKPGNPGLKPFARAFLKA